MTTNSAASVPPVVTLPRVSEPLPVLVMVKVRLSVAPTRPTTSKSVWSAVAGTASPSAMSNPLPLTAISGAVPRTSKVYGFGPADVVGEAQGGVAGAGGGGVKGDLEGGGGAAGQAVRGWLTTVKSAVCVPLVVTVPRPSASALMLVMV